MTPDSQSQPHRHPRSRYHLLALLAVALLAFSPLLKGQFTTFDDVFWIGKNSALNPPSLSGLADRWRGPFNNLYTPLAHTVWYLVAVVAWRGHSTDGGGVPGASGSLGAPGMGLNDVLDPSAFHAASLLLHLVATLGVYTLLRQVLTRPLRITPADRTSTAHLPALAGAALFCLHPLSVEAVGWISGLKDVLCTTLMIWTLAAAARAADGSVQPPTEFATSPEFKPSPFTYLRLWAPVALGTLLSILAKPTAVMLPAMVLALVALLHRPTWRQASALAVAGGLLALPFAFLTARWQVSVPVPDGVAGLSRGLVALDSLGFYLCKIVWPLPLDSFCIDYARTAGWVTRDLHWLSGVALILGAAAFVTLSRDRILQVGLLLFALPVLPVAGLRDFDFSALSVVADHYGYPTLLGASVLLARLTQLALAWATPRLSARRGLASAGIALACLLSFLTYYQANVWRDSRSLYEHGIVVSPRSVTSNSNLAALELNAASPNYARALSLAQAAITTWPKFDTANFNAGRASAALGEFSTALRYFNVAAATPRYYRHDPAYHVAVGNVYAETNRLDRAVAQYREALRLDPTNPAARARLAQVEAYVALQPATTRGSK